MTDETQPGPTGRIRYRAHKTWSGRQFLVLQIEERVFVNEGGSTALTWRDATTEDLTVES